MGKFADIIKRLKSNPDLVDELEPTDLLVVAHKFGIVEVDDGLRASIGGDHIASYGRPMAARAKHLVRLAVRRPFDKAHRERERKQAEREKVKQEKAAEKAAEKARREAEKAERQKAKEAREAAKKAKEAEALVAAEARALAAGDEAVDDVQALDEGGE
jgi:hypothetical protein